MSKAFSLAALIVGGLIAADLWAHYKTTHAVLNFGAKESRYLAGR
jgi:hypothetical protein